MKKLLTSRSHGSNSGVTVCCMTVLVENSNRGLIPFKPKETLFYTITVFNVHVQVYL